MRDNPRYSFIPAGAVFDSSLEDRDLRALALLGCHTDKLGWVEASSQSALAAMIGCSRQTFQRSMARLVSAGWVQAKTKFVSDSGRPYAPYAYRVIMDRDGPEFLSAVSEVAGEMAGEGAHGRAPVPIGEQGGAQHAGQGCPRMHGHQESEQAREQESESLESAREREPLISEEANRIADQIAEIAGYPDPKGWPPGWHGAAMRVDAFLREGYHPEVLLAAARETMAALRERGGELPWSIRYFEKPFAKARARQRQGLPTISILEPQRATINGAVEIRSDKSATAAAVRSMRRGMDRRANSAVDVSLPARRLRQPGDVCGTGSNEPDEVSAGDHRVRDRSDNGSSNQV